MSSELRKLARKLLNLEDRTRRPNTPQLASSAIVGAGTIPQYDAEGKVLQTIGTQFDGTTGTQTFNGPIPPRPTAPVCVEANAFVQVYWDGAFLDAAYAPLDLTRVDVHILVDPTVNPLTVSPICSIVAGGWGQAALPLEPGTYFAVLVAWTTSGKYSVGEMSGAFYVYDTIAALSDGDAPALAPVITTAPIGIGAVQVLWEAIPNPDPVTYGVYASLTTPVALEEANLVETTASTAAVISSLGGVPLPRGVDVYVVVVPADADGEGPASNEASAQPRNVSADDLGANAITPESMRSDALVPNLIRNGSFEEIDSGGNSKHFETVASNWATITNTDDEALLGERSLAITTGAGTWLNAGVRQTEEAAIPVTPLAGQRMAIGVSAKASVTLDRGTSLRAWWYGNDGSALTKTLTIVKQEVNTNRLFLTTSEAHNLLPGDPVVITGLGAPYDGAFTLGWSQNLGATWSPTKFSVPLTRADEAEASVTGSVTTTSVTNAVTAAAVGTTWTRLSGQVEVPPDAASLRAGIYQSNIGNAATTHFDAFSADRVVIAGYVAANSVSTNEISTDYAYAGKVEAAQVMAGTVGANLVLAGSIKTSEGLPRVELSGSGLLAFDTDGGIRATIPTDPNAPVSVRGQFEATSMDVRGALSVSGTDNGLTNGSRFTLGTGVGAPSSAPVAAPVFPASSIAAPIPGEFGWKKLSDGNWYSAYNEMTWNATRFHVVKRVEDAWGDLGAPTSVITDGATPSQPNQVLSIMDFCEVDGRIYVLASSPQAKSVGYGSGHDSGAPEEIRQYDMTTGTFIRGHVVRTPPGDMKAAMSSRPNQPSEVLVLRAHGSTGQWWVRAFDLPTSGSGSSWTPLSPVGVAMTALTVADDVMSFQETSQDALLGAGASGRWVATRRQHPTAYVLDSSGRYMDEEFDSPSGSGGSVWFDGSRWHAMNAANAYHLSDFKWPGYNATQKWWVRHTWFDSDGTGGQHESALSPARDFAMQKFAHVAISTTGLPIPEAGSHDNVTGVRIYLKRNAASAPAPTDYKRAATDLADGATSATYDSPLDESVTYSAGALPPFPDGVPSEFESVAGGFVIRGDGTGAWPLMESHAAGLQRATAQSIPDSTWTRVAVDATDFDSPGLTPGAGNSIVAESDGLYLATGVVSWALSATGRYASAVYVNGVARRKAYAAASSAKMTSTVVTVLPLLAGDYVQLYGYQSSGSALSTETDDGVTYLEVVRLGGPLAS